MAFNKLTSIRSICRIPNITYINASYNKISKISKNIINLNHLHELNLCDNKISKISTNIKKYTSSELKLYYNKISNSVYI